MVLVGGHFSEVFIVLVGAESISFGKCARQGEAVASYLVINFSFMVAPVCHGLSSPRFTDKSLVQNDVDMVGVCICLHVEGGP